MLVIDMFKACVIIMKHELLVSSLIVYSITLKVSPTLLVSLILAIVTVTVAV